MHDVSFSNAAATVDHSELAVFAKNIAELL
jgi:hypothetical protein